MVRQGNPSLHLSPTERKTLELVLQGIPVDHIAVTLNKSPKVVERYILQGLQKVERWSHRAVPGPRFHTLQEEALGILTPRQADRIINRSIHDLGDQWACIVVAAIPDDPKSTHLESSIEAISHHIYRSVRRYDVVTKWSTTEWVIFLPRMTSDSLQTVMRRLRHGHHQSWPILVGAKSGVRNQSFFDLAMACHHELMAQYVHGDLASLHSSLTSNPR